MLATLSDAVPLTQALRRFFPPGRTGNPVHLSTALRWIHRGIVASNGERVRLSALKIGGQTYITAAAAEAFVLALNAGSAAAQDHADADFSRRAKEAGAALEALGC
jgi:hypothetical protein